MCYQLSAISYQLSAINPYPLSPLAPPTYYSLLTAKL